MSLIELKVNRISYSQSQNGAYALILEENDGERKLPIVIGGFEAQSIAIALKKTSNHLVLLPMIYLKNLQKILKSGSNK